MFVPEREIDYVALCIYLGFVYIIIHPLEVIFFLKKEKSISLIYCFKINRIFKKFSEMHIITASIISTEFSTLY